MLQTEIEVNGYFLNPKRTSFSHRYPLKHPVGSITISNVDCYKQTNGVLSCVLLLTTSDGTILFLSSPGRTVISKICLVFSMHYITFYLFRQNWMGKGRGIIEYHYSWIHWIAYVRYRSRNANWIWDQRMWVIKLLNFNNTSDYYRIY